MTYLADQVTINQAWRDGSWFNKFMDATGQSGFDIGKRRASQQVKILDFIRSSGIKWDMDFGKDEFSNEYTMTSFSGNVGSTGTKVTGNPTILTDEREIFEKLVKINSNDIATKFQNVEWAELKRVMFQSTQGLTQWNDRMNDLQATHIAKALKLITAKFLYGFGDQYTTFTNGSTTGVTESFSLQSQYLTPGGIPFNLTFEALQNIPRLLMDAGKIPEDDGNIQTFLILPDIIFDALITKTLSQNPLEFNKIIGANDNTGSFTYYKNGQEFSAKNRINAESIKYEVNLEPGISIRRANKIESYQIFEQNIANTVNGAKTFKCPIWIGNEGFKFSQPTPNAVNELMNTSDDQRMIMSSGKQNVWFEERRLGATTALKEFSTNQYRVVTRQAFVPLQLENAGTLELDVPGIIGGTQGDFETLIDNQYKIPYQNAFYDTNHTDDNHNFIKPVI